MGIGEKILYIVSTFEEGNKSKFARKIGVPNGSSAIVHDWIAGKKRPGNSYRECICTVYGALGVDMAWLESPDLMPPIPKHPHHVPDGTDRTNTNPAGSGTVTLTYDDISRILRIWEKDKSVHEKLAIVLDKQVSTIDILARKIEQLSMPENPKKCTATN
jgi:hypothetical protein